MNFEQEDKKPRKKRALFTGLISDCKIWTVNPTKAWLEKNGFASEKDPVYATTVEEKGETFKKLRLNFYIQSAGSKFEGVITFWLEQRSADFMNPKTNQFVEIFMDECGSTYQVTEGRKPFKGEAQLNRFLKDVLDISKGSRFCIFNNPDNEEEVNRFFVGEIGSMRTALLEKGKKFTVRAGIRVTDKGAFQYVHPVVARHWAEAIQLGNLEKDFLNAKGADIEAGENSNCVEWTDEMKKRFIDRIASQRPAKSASANKNDLDENELDKPRTNGAAGLEDDEDLPF